MTGLRRGGWAGLLALVVAGTGCLNEDLTFYVTDLTVQVQTGATGPVTLVAHHASQGDGALQHPLGPIDEAEFDTDLIQWTVAYPLHAGTGLVLYGWQDVDGDGALCAPGAEPEPSGLVEVVEFPAFALDVTLPLDALCRGAEALYPDVTDSSSAR
jgi:hypothetical protein